MYEAKTRITYYDLDYMGRMKLSALLRMVHIAADVNANELGIGFRELSRLNMSFVLQRFALGLNRMPAYDETVTVRTWPDSVAKGTFLRKGDMYAQSGEKIMEWASLWILFDIAARKILKPSALLAEISASTGQGVEITPEKIALPDDESGKLLTSRQGHESGGGVISEYMHTVRYAEVDTNMHMNNSIYGDLIGNALFTDIAVKNESWREVQINYLAETRFGETIKITAYREGENIYVTGKTPEKTAFAARVSVAGK